MKKLNKLEKYAIVMELLVGVIAFGLIVVISIGFDFDFSQLATGEFWLKVLTKLALCVVVYNIYVMAEEQNRRLRRTQIIKDDGTIEYRNSIYQQNVLTYRERKKTFYGIDADTRYTKMQEALAARNKRNKESAYDTYLHNKVTTRISFSQLDFDNLTDAMVDDLCIKLSFTKKQTKKFKKAIDKMQDGKVEYAKINDRDILVDKLEHKDVSDLLDSSYTNKIIMRNNIGKVISFGASQIVVTLIAWRYTSTDIWREIITNFSVLTSAVFSAYKTAKKLVDFKTSNYEERVHFLDDLLNPKKEIKETV